MIVVLSFNEWFDGHQIILPTKLLNYIMDKVFVPLGKRRRDFEFNSINRKKKISFVTRALGYR